MTEVAKILLVWFALSIVAAPVIGRALKRAGDAQSRPFTYDKLALTAAGRFHTCTRDDCVPESDGTATGHKHAGLEVS